MTIETLKKMCGVGALSLSVLALSACGGGSESGDDADYNGSDAGNGSENAQSSSGGTESRQESMTAPERAVDQFVEHMANMEYGEASDLVSGGADAGILAEYVQAIDNVVDKDNGLLDAIFSSVGERFADAKVELGEMDGESAIVKLTVEEEVYEIDVAALDGTNWLLNLPQGVLLPLQEVMMRSMPAMQGLDPNNTGGANVPPIPTGGD